MNKTRLVECINKILPSIDDHELVAKLNPLSGSYSDNLRFGANVPETAKLELARVLAEDEACRRLEGTKVRFFNGETFIYLRSLAYRLLTESRATSAVQAVDALERYALADRVEVTLILVLWGLHPSAPTEIASGLHLVPLNSLRQSEMTDRFIMPHAYNLPVQFPVRFARARAALIRKVQFGPPILDASCSPVFSTMPTSNVDISQLERNMRETALCLSLIATHGIEPVSFWSEVDCNPLFGPVMGGHGWSPAGCELEIGPHDIDVTDTRALVQAYSQLRPDARARLEIPLKRLNESTKNRDNHADSALDLGIALESLLTSDLGKDEPISYNMRLRGALLLEGTMEDRRYHFMRLRDAYNLRGDAAHKGKVEKKQMCRKS
jgi:hypothetical protein